MARSRLMAILLVAVLALMPMPGRGADGPPQGVQPGADGRRDGRGW